MWVEQSASTKVCVLSYIESLRALEWQIRKVFESSGAQVYSMLYANTPHLGRCTRTRYLNIVMKMFKKIKKFYKMKVRFQSFLLRTNIGDNIKFLFITGQSVHYFKKKLLFF